MEKKRTHFALQLQKHVSRKLGLLCFIHRRLHLMYGVVMYRVNKKQATCSAIKPYMTRSASGICSWSTKLTLENYSSAVDSRTRCQSIDVFLHIAASGCLDRACSTEHPNTLGERGQSPRECRLLSLMADTSVNPLCRQCLFLLAAQGDHCRNRLALLLVHQPVCFLRQNCHHYHHHSNST